MPRRLGMAPKANYALHFDPKKAMTHEQRERFKEFVMIDLVSYENDNRPGGGDARETLSSSDATKRREPRCGTISLDDFYVMMTNRTLHLFQNSGQGATQSCERLREFASRDMATVPHNCAWHRQWLIPYGFIICGPHCRAAFCGCVNQY